MTYSQVIGEAIRGRDAAWLVELMHDYDQIPGGQFKNKYPEFAYCVEASPFMGSESTLMALLKMAAGIHYAQVDRSRNGQDAEERLDAQRESAVVADDAPTMGKSDQEGA